MDVVRLAWSVLGIVERRRAGMLLVMIFLMGIADVVGIAAIFPFMSLLIEPELLSTNTFLAKLYGYFGGIEVSRFTSILGIMVLALFIFSIVIRGITSYLQIRFIYYLEYGLSKRIIAGYLNQPYSWLLEQNSSELGKNILSEVSVVVQAAVLPIVVIVAQSIVVFFLVFFIALIEPLAVAFIVLVLAILYFIFYSGFRVMLIRLGVLRLDNNEKRFFVVNEAFESIKNLKLSRIEEVYTQRFDSAAGKFASAQTYAYSIAQLPRLLVEVFIFGGSLAVMLYIANAGDGLEAALPTIALCALAAQRILPGCQQIYGSFAQLRYSKPSLAKIAEDLATLDSMRNAMSKVDSQEVRFERDIVLNNVSFRYAGSKKNAIDNVSMTIKRNSSIGIVGSTGSGKSTLIDLIVGLLTPDTGQISLDGLEITSDFILSWQGLIGYIPQDVYLSDNSIAGNIAFGQDIDAIDMKDVIRAAKLANIHEYIINDTADGYLSMVGDKGVKLSGGQKQRIAIARALYRRPKVLLLDEASSALDSATEKEVMAAINNISREITTIIVTHRLSTIVECDTIILLEKGCIKAFGSYETLLAESSLFQNLIEI